MPLRTFTFRISPKSTNYDHSLLICGKIPFKLFTKRKVHFDVLIWMSHTRLERSKVDDDLRWKWTVKMLISHTANKSNLSQTGRTWTNFRTIFGQNCMVYYYLRYESHWPVRPIQMTVHFRSYGPYHSKYELNGILYIYESYVWPTYGRT